MADNAIKTMKELNNLIEFFDEYSFDSYDSTISFRSHFHYANQTHNVEGEALAFLLEEEVWAEYWEDFAEEEAEEEKARVEAEESARKERRND